ncbi:hypothetical protein LEN26_006265 [Aphanomyces euteiches]|nr:hypothetical protein AeMF1_021849 [Aphanomyces euteiches]KAH9136173.1 hypothetical protein LEN26_006265 [Aphanomyces euteiches]KAH9192102.1 hypothetical protein AeNC1_005918 [Aphanomyces euteiches]
MLHQFQQVYQSKAEDDQVLADQVAIFLQNEDGLVPREDLVWIWELLVVSRELMRRPSVDGGVDTPLGRQCSAVREVLLPFSSIHSEMLHGLPSVCNVILDVCFDTHTAQKVLSVLLEHLLPEYDVASMDEFHIDWKIAETTLARYDPLLTRHLSDHNVSIEILCSQWFFSLFADSMPNKAAVQIYTWVLVAARTSTSKKHLNHLISTALAVLFYLSDVVLSAHDASTIVTLVDHFCHHVLGTDDEILAIFLGWCRALHDAMDDTFDSIRMEMQLEESTLPRRIFVGWRSPPKPRDLSAISRETAWPRYLSLHNKANASYASYLNQSIDDDLQAAIDMDIPRTTNAVREHHDALRRGLVAFAVRNPSIGYCQGMNEIYGVLLRFLDEETAFAALVFLVEDVFPGYHRPDLLGLHMDCSVVETLLRQNDPHLLHHLHSLGLNMEVLCTNWFMASFVTTTPACFHLRILDMLLESGTSRVVVVAVVAIVLNLSPLLTTQIEIGGVVNQIKQFLANLDPNPSAFLSVVRTLFRQFSQDELDAMRRYYTAATEGTSLPKADSNKAPSSGIFKRRFFPGSPSKAIKDTTKKLPSFLMRKRHIPKDIRDESKLNSHLDKTMQLLEDETIDATEYAHIKEQIVSTWSATTHTPLHAQSRVDLLKARVIPPRQTKQPSIVSRQTAKARASLNALSAKWRQRSPARSKKPTSPHGLRLSEIASSYYGGDLNLGGGGVARKSELRAKTLFK